MKMIAFAVPILEGKLEDWKQMILGNMLGENKKATDESREYAGVQERSYLQKMSKGHVCILTWEGNDPLSFWLDLMKIALPEFTDHLADLHGRGIFKEENPESMLAEMVYDSKDEQSEILKKDEKTEMIAIALPILPGKIEVWKTKILDKMLGENKKETDAIRHAAGVRERSFLQETPDGHMVITTFEGRDPVAGYSQVMQKLPSDFAELVMEVHGLDLNAAQPPMPELVYNSHE